MIVTHASLSNEPKLEVSGFEASTYFHWKEFLQMILKVCRLHLLPDGICILKLIRNLLLTEGYVGYLVW